MSHVKLKITIMMSASPLPQRKVAVVSNLDVGILEVFATEKAGKVVARSLRLANKIIYLLSFLPTILS